MTMLDDRPATGATPAPPPLRDRGVLAPWRLAARLAWRETRRRPGRTVLAALLIAVPVVAMTLGSVLLRTDARADNGTVDFRLRYGDTADVAFDPSMMGGEDLEAPDEVAVPAGTRRIEYLWTGTAVTPSAPGFDARYTTWTDIDLTDPTVGTAIDIVDGRAPQPGEIMIGPDLADAWDLTVGDSLELTRPSGTWTVAGIGRYRADYWTDVVVAPGFDPDRITDDYRNVVTVFDMPPGTPATEIDRVMFAVGGRSAADAWFSSSGPPANEIAWGWVGGVLALVATGIIVSAAFATSARRQLVTVGQLASNGATPAVVRRTLALQGTWTAAAGALGGLALGLGSLPVLMPSFERWIAKRQLPDTVVSVGDLVVIAVTALVAGTVAAGVPARAISRTPVMSALAGRRPLGAPPRWLVPTGVALVLGGLGLLFVAALGVRSGGSDDAFALAIILGGVAVVFGMICATPLILDRLGRLARFLPLSPRLALRGMARSRTRSAAVVAAIAVAAGGAIVIATLAEAAIQEDAFYHGVSSQNLAPGAIVIQAYDDPGSGSDLGADPALPVRRTLTDAQLDAIARIFPDATVEPLLVAGFDPPAFRWSDPDVRWTSGDGPWIATPAVVRAVGLSAADQERLERDGALVGRPDPTLAVVPASPGDTVTFEFGRGDDMIAVEAGLSDDALASSVANMSAVVTEEHAAELGFEIVERGVVVTGAGRVTRAQADDVYEAVGLTLGSDAFVEPGDPPRTLGALSYWNVIIDAAPDPDDGSVLWIARAVIVAAALLLVSLVVAIGLALAAVEGREERETLAVVGATPSTMRRQAAVRAAVLAAVGIALGIPTGYVPVEVVANAANEGGNQFLRFPWVASALLLAAVPLAVAGAAWLASGVGQRLRPVSPTRRD